MFVLAFPLGTTVTLRMCSSGFYGVTAMSETCLYTITKRQKTDLREWEQLRVTGPPETGGASSGASSGDRQSEEGSA